MAELVDALDSKSSSARSVGSSPTRATRNKTPRNVGVFLWPGSDEKESDQKRSRKIENFVGDLSPEIKMSPTGDILFSHSNSTQNTNLYHPVGIRITHYYVIIPYQPHTYPQTSPLGL